MSNTENSSNRAKNTGLSPEEIQRLILLAAQNQTTRADKTLQICDQVISALKSAPPLSDALHEQLAEIYLIQGNTYQNLCDHQNALQAILYSLEEVRTGKNSLAVGDRLVLIAKIHTHLKNYSEALSEIYRALEIAQRNEDRF
ncbi:MAG: hypothetical protein ACK2T7_03180, partial [Anaerolineales bacterium]